MTLNKSLAVIFLVTVNFGFYSQADEKIEVNVHLKEPLPYEELINIPVQFSNLSIGPMEIDRQICRRLTNREFKYEFNRLSYSVFKLEGDEVQKPVYKIAEKVKEACSKNQGLEVNSFLSKLDGACNEGCNSAIAPLMPDGTRVMSYNKINESISQLSKNRSDCYSVCTRQRNWAQDFVSAFDQGAKVKAVQMGAVCGSDSKISNSEIKNMIPKEVDTAITVLDQHFEKTTTKGH